jgi:hypothetical protein
MTGSEYSLIALGLLAFACGVIWCVRRRPAARLWNRGDVIRWRRLRSKASR